MASRTCYRCGTWAHMTMVADASRLKDDDALWTMAHRCDNCGAISAAVTEPAVPESILNQASSNRTTALRSAFDSSDDLDWQPVLISGHSYDYVPAHIAEAADEAHRCRSIGAFKASAILARAVVEATAKDKGVKESGIYAKIEALHAADHLSKHAKAEAHEIRFFGNSMAHGDFVTSVTDSEAGDVLDLMNAVLSEVYENPGRVKRITANREAKQAAAKAAATSAQATTP